MIQANPIAIVAAIITIAAVIIGVKCYQAYTALKLENERLVKDQTENLQKKDDEIADLKQKNVDSETKCTNLGADLKNADADLKTLDADLKTAKAESKTKLNKEIADLKKANTLFQTMIEELNLKIETLSKPVPKPTEYKVKQTTTNNKKSHSK